MSQKIWEFLTANAGRLFNGLATSSYIVLDNPTVDELQEAFGSVNEILVFADRVSETGEILSNKTGWYHQT